MSLGYEEIKQLAREMRSQGESVRVGDLLALHPLNDPFYVGTPGDVEKAEWFAELWRRGGFSQGAHLRRIHYWLVSQEHPTKPNGTPYENTDNDWGYLCAAGKMARYLGLVGFGEIADHRNPDPHLNAEYEQWGPEYTVKGLSLDRPSVHLWGGFEEALAQPYHLEVWCEKSTMNDVLLPVCERYTANLVTGLGEMSITAVHELIGRLKIARKPARIFYISDFDPAGQSMPKSVARKLEWILRQREMEEDVRLTPLVLTAKQQREYRLPRTPIKPSELRRASFEEVHGSGAVELDALEALHPGELGRIVEEALATYYSEEAARDLRQKRHGLYNELSAKAGEIMDGYRSQLEALREMNRELQSVTVDVDEYRVTAAPATADDGLLPWLLQSGRDYIEQLEVYKAFGDGDLDGNRET